MTTGEALRKRAEELLVSLLHQSEWPIDALDIRDADVDVVIAFGKEQFERGQQSNARGG